MKKALLKLTYFITFVIFLVFSIPNTNVTNVNALLSSPMFQFKLIVENSAE